MQRVSSRMTFYYKWVFPLIWFGFLAIFIGLALTAAKGPGGPPLLMIVVPVAMGIFGYFLMKKLVWNLADQVLDAGDSLVVRFGHEEERISLAQIMNVSYANMTSPQRITLTLRFPTQFGREVAFAPPQTWIPFGRSPIVADLIQRVDAARQTAK